MTRPRLCATCHEPATWAIEETCPMTHINMQAKVTRTTHAVQTYYCDTHIDAAWEAT